jgi:hypothetical protein
MDTWVTIFGRSGLNGVIAHLKSFMSVTPLSDLLHLDKNFRTRFPKHELTFAYGRVEITISQARVREILRLEAPLTDPTQTGKMRDGYPLALMRIENVLAFVNGGTIAEAIALLPMTLCLSAVRLDTVRAAQDFIC